MSGFSRDWLALREPADHAARNPAIMDRCAARFAGRDDVSVTDIGCGTGTSLRAMAAVLPRRQFWRMVDHDAALLAAAREALRAWADAAVPAGDGLKLMKHDRVSEVDFIEADLARDLPAALGPAADLVTASALFDLCSRRWIDACADVLAARALPLLAVLNYDGEERWLPPPPDEAGMMAAFLQHQRGDKGFGPACGPDAAAALRDALSRHGFRVAQGASPWRLGRQDAALIQALADGSAAAVLSAAMPPDAVERWQQARRTAEACHVGHIDVFASPPG